MPVPVILPDELSVAGFCRFLGIFRVDEPIICSQGWFCFFSDDLSVFSRCVPLAGPCRAGDGGARAGNGEARPLPAVRRQGSSVWCGPRAAVAAAHRTEENVLRSWFYERYLFIFILNGC